MSIQPTNLTAHDSLDNPGRFRAGSTLAGQLLLQNELAGNLVGIATLSGALSLGLQLQGQLDGVAILTGQLSGQQQLVGDLVGTSALTGRIEGETEALPRIPATADICTIFTAGELAQSATYNGVLPITVIYSEFYSEIFGGNANMIGTDPFMYACYEDIPDVQDGDTIQVNTGLWEVREVQRGNAGVVRLKCERIS